MKKNTKPPAVYYQIFVRSFCDSNSDGIGDINGVIEKLDYLLDLGVEGIWLMPIHPSPSYHKYDVTDYYNIDPEYGTLEDFRRLVDEAHKRNIRVIIDLVVNHTSKQHPWFVKATDPAFSEYYNFYHWRKAALKYTDGWHKLPSSETGDAYFGHFSSEMPDLNFDYPPVQDEVLKIGKFWLEELGVDGFRLDAAQHIFPGYAHDKNCAWWQKFRKVMEAVKEDVFLVGEVWSACHVAAPYLDKGLHAVFNFDLSYKIVETAAKERNRDLAGFHKQARIMYATFSEAFTDATFISNHDQERVMSSVKKNVNRAKVAAALLFTLPGTPFIYYGEELGMLGKKPDENIREPFRWSDDGPDTTRWLPLKHNKKIPSLAVQIKDKNSFWNYYRSLIQLRINTPLLKLGEMEPVALTNNKSIAFFRSTNNQHLLVVINPSSKSIIVRIPIPAGNPEIYFRSNEGVLLTGNTLTMPGYATGIVYYR